MLLNPHPIVLTTVAERRRVELIALAEQEQHTRRAVPVITNYQRWSAFHRARAASGILALLLAVVRFD